MESWVQSWRPRTNAFCDVSSSSVQTTAPATKKWCQDIRSAAPVTQNHPSKPEDRRLQNATPRRKSAPGPPSISEWTRLLYRACHGKSIFADPLQMSHACHGFWKCYKTLTFCSLLTRCIIPCACHAKRHLNVQKWCERVMLCTFWLRNVLRASSRHNGVHFFDISTSKSGPNLMRFVHFDLEMYFAPQRRGLFRHRNVRKWSEHGVFLHFDFEMCFAPQRRALFRHLNFQKWSEHVVFCTRLRNVLRATTACNFSSLIWPAGSALAALASLLFRSSRASNHWKKHSVSQLSYLFAHLHLLSSDSFSSLIFSLLLFSSLLWLLPPLLFICPYCRKFDF